MPLHLIVVYGFGKEPMLLLTNLERDDKRLSNTIVKVYLMRWRIEEYFRFKKQQYALEDFRVRSLRSIRTLHRIVTLLAGLIGILSDQREESVFVTELIEISYFFPNLKFSMEPRKSILIYSKRGKHDKIGK